MATTIPSKDPFFIYDGLYEISEAARIINVTAHLPELEHHITNRHVLRWIRKGLALPRLGELHGTEILLSFEDLISMRVIALLKAVGVKWTKIYEAESWLRSYTGSDRPFATETLWTAGHEVFHERQGELIAASMGGQYPFKELIADYLVPVAGMTFNTDGRAESWSPKGLILLKPTIQFGSPCVKGTRITTSTLAGMYDAGDSIESIARIYDLSTDEVEEAIEWEKRLSEAA